MGKSADEIKSPEEIQAEIRRTEEDMTTTIESIQRRLSPTHLKEQAMDKAREAAGKNFDKIKGIALDNPVPVLLGGAAAIMIMLKLKRGRNRQPLSASAGAGHLAAMAGESPEVISGASGMGGRAPSRGARAIQTAAGKPLMAVGLGIALGVLAAAVIPLSRRENQLMGTTRDDLLDKAKGAAQEAVQTVRRFTGGSASAGETVV